MTMVAYEIHAYREGRWKIDSVFDDRELALFEAKRMDQGGRFSGVRVIEEVYDEITKKTSIRTIFRGSKVTESNKVSITQRHQTVREAKEARIRREKDERLRSQTQIKNEMRRKSNPYRLVTIMALLGLLLIGAMIGLQYVSASL